jgi:hypothetical protein
MVAWMVGQGKYEYGESGGDVEIVEECTAIQDMHDEGVDVACGDIGQGGW